MPGPNQKLIQNRLLSLLSPENYELVQPHLEPIVLPRAYVLAEPNEPSVNLHFLESGLASQIAVTADNRRLEVGIYGRDGMGPTSSILGADRAPHRLIIQVEGHGFLIAARTLIAILDRSPQFRALILRYIQAFTVQTSYTALSNGSAVIGERLARWLLMCRDRIDDDDLPLTHEHLRIILGVRRAGVTDAIHMLEGFDIIRATRGNIRILDREKLEDKAGDCYGVPEAEYRRLIGPLE
jgi:CRP-like cAMP-binding protein